MPLTASDMEKMSGMADPSIMKAHRLVKIQYKFFVFFILEILLLLILLINTKVFPINESNTVWKGHLRGVIATSYSCAKPPAFLLLMPPPRCSRCSTFHCW